MDQRPTTVSDYLREVRDGAGGIDGGLADLLGTLAEACRAIAGAIARDGLDAVDVATSVNVQGEEQKPLDVIANTLMLKICERGGQLSGMASEELEAPYPVQRSRARGPYLLLFDPLDGSSNVEVNTTVGTIFSVLRSPDPGRDVTVEDFLQPGHRQVAAGYALYGPCSMLVLSVGRGVHGFTLDPGTGAYVSTHPAMTIPAQTSEFAINASNARHWEPPVVRYVDECVGGRTGPRERDFNMRWIGSMVAEVHRLLVRGGLYMYPRDTQAPGRRNRLRLLYEANPMAMLVEQAGGHASTGRERLLDVPPTELHQRIPVILGSRREVERLVEYHAAYDRGEPSSFEAPLFNRRSLFRSP